MGNRQQKHSPVNPEEKDVQKVKQPLQNKKTVPTSRSEEFIKTEKTHVWQKHKSHKNCIRTDHTRSNKVQQYGVLKRKFE